MKKIDISLIMKGFTMGAADIVPGVSGGTVALITGIYDELVQTISQYDHHLVKLLLKRQFESFFKRANLSFLTPLFAGIFTAIISLSKIMHYMMENYSVYTWSLFFGLIVSSILYIGKNLKNDIAPKSILFVILGTFIGYAIVSLIPVQTANTPIMIFLSGAIAICAMILPGISGSFILLILGKYLFVTAALKNPFHIESISTIIIFSLGCLVGLLSFSKVLNYLLSRFHHLMMCTLTGFMIGSLKKIWPWREVLEKKIVRGKTHILSDQVVFPESLNSEVFIALAIMIFGILLVFLVERLGNKRGVSSAG